MQRHLLSMGDVDQRLLERLLLVTGKLKRERRSLLLHRRVAALIFERPSLRTRLSFDVAVRQLGGHAVSIPMNEVDLGRQQRVADLARELTCLVDVAVIRANEHEVLGAFADASRIPVINGRTDLEHPCQALADLYTVQELKGRLRGIVFAYFGEWTAVASSLLLAAGPASLRFRVSCPPSMGPGAAVLDRARARGADVDIVDDPVKAAEGADVLCTDAWSIGPSGQPNAERLRRYQVNSELLRHARPDAIVLHEMPARRGQEISGDVIDGSQSAVFLEAENRLHVEKAILSLLLAAQDE